MDAPKHAQLAALHHCLGVVAGAELDCHPCLPLPWHEADEGHGERRDASENRRRILAAARALFAERGVDQVSMHEIAKAAGIGQGTLYRRYAHKGLLSIALLDENLRQHHAEVVARLANPDMPALAHLDYFLTSHASFIEANASLLGAMADAACGERRADAHENPVHTWLHATVSALLARAVANGEIPPLDIPPPADIVLAPLGIDAYIAQRQGRGYPAERILAAIRRVIFDGLRGNPTPSTAPPE